MFEIDIKVKSRFLRGVTQLNTTKIDNFWHLWLVDDRTTFHYNFHKNKTRRFSWKSNRVGIIQHRGIMNQGSSLLISFSGEEPFYASMSIVRPDLNSTVKWPEKTAIFSMSFLTRASSNSMMSVFCLAMKSCSSLIRFSQGTSAWVISKWLMQRQTMDLQPVDAPVKYATENDLGKAVIAGEGALPAGRAGVNHAPSDNPCK